MHCYKNMVTLGLTCNIVTNITLKGVSIGNTLVIMQKNVQLQMYTTVGYVVTQLKIVHHLFTDVSIVSEMV